MSFHAPTIVAIHGSASSSKQWETLRALAEPTYQLVAPNIPEADSEMRLSATLAPIVQSPTPVHLVAHSFGSSIAMKAANVVPHNIASITLFDPVVPIGDVGETQVPSALSALSAAMRRATPEEGMALFFDFWSGADAWANSPYQRRDALTARYGSVVRDFEQVVAEDWTPTQKTYAGPLTILHGEQSPSVIDETVGHLERTYPHAWRVLVRDLNHMAPLTHAQITNQLFLDSIDCNWFAKGLRTAA